MFEIVHNAEIQGESADCEHDMKSKWDETEAPDGALSRALLPTRLGKPVGGRSTCYYSMQPRCIMY